MKDMQNMKTCEHFETELSTWIDGQLDHAGQIESLDHLLRCASCRGFYRDIRALDGWIEAVRTPSGAAAPSREVWQRIVAAAGQPSPRRRAVPAWAWQAAAALLVTVGLTLAVWKGGGGATAPAPAEAELLLGRGPMSDARFVELTREVLQADRRYHSAMYDVMRQVVHDTAAVREASIESGARSEERGVAETAERAGRNPA